MITTVSSNPLPIPALFIGDNGRCTCLQHSGNSIRGTGRDVSGQEALGLTLAEAEEHGVFCEDCAELPYCFQGMSTDWVMVAVDDGLPLFIDSTPCHGNPLVMAALEATMWTKEDFTKISYFSALTGLTLAWEPMVLATQYGRPEAMSASEYALWLGYALTRGEA